MNRLNKTQLLENLRLWDQFLKCKIHLIACGGTAMTLMGIKPSTKDIDFIVPDQKEYEYLTGTLKDLGYQQQGMWGWKKEGDPFRYDLFPGKKIHTTDLLDSSLEEGRHYLFEELGHIFIGILNFYDLIASKLMRGDRVDFDDCLALYAAKRNEIDLAALKEHYFELISYDISEERIKGHWESFERLINK